MIRSWKDKKAKALFDGLFIKGFPAELQDLAEKKLLSLHAAAALQDLRIPPGNRLESLIGDRIGQYSIRINAQWRICFVWQDGNAFDVAIVDYH